MRLEAQPKPATANERKLYTVLRDDVSQTYKYVLTNIYLPPSLLPCAVSDTLEAPPQVSDGKELHFCTVFCGQITFPE